MYGADDCLPLSGQPHQQLQHRGRHEGVQPAGRLVTEQQRRVSQHLYIYIYIYCTVEKAKVVAAVLGTELLQYLAALAILH